MDNLFTSQLPPDQLQRQLQARRQQQAHRAANSGMRNLNTNTAGQTNQHNNQHSNQHNNQRPIMSGMGDSSMAGCDSLDDIIIQNSNELHRRRSIPHPFSPHHASPQEDHDRRMSMMEFGSTNGSLQDFQLGSSLGSPVQANIMADGMPNYGNINISGPGPAPGQSGAFSQPNMLAMAGSNGFPSMSHDVMGNMMALSNLNMGQMGSDPNSMHIFSNPGMTNQFPNNGMDPMNSEFTMDMNTADDPLNAATTGPPTSINLDERDDDMMTASQAYDTNGSVTAHAPHQGKGRSNSGFSMPPPLSRELSNATSFHQSPVSPIAQGTPHQNTNKSSIVAETPVTAVATSTPSGTLEVKAEKNVYSKSGFDMIRALFYVATRPNQQIQLGAVDMSCAFVVCDIALNDCPIIYVSDNFQNLTGYSRHDIVGQNCRFLQAPDGKVEAGTKREFVENDAVYNLKKKIAEGKEVQQSLINYRKGGKPFLNLLTMIPIPWDDPNEIRYFIGFQIDLVECPDAISGQEGGISINYKHSDIGQYIWTPPGSSQWEPENGQTLGVDDVSTLLQQFNPKGAVSDWHKQSWDKMLLENTDDVVHVLSLKGLFLYLSPSCKKVLEYDTLDLVGNSLSSICHPSDIIPVTRELKDTAAGSPVNIVFRIRRKLSGYTWFESHGSLFVEQGKGRKCIILVGRKRPVFVLSMRDLEAHGGIGDGELWTKLSTSGMFLFVSSNVRSLLDLQPEQLVGTSITDCMRKESKPEFGRSIEKARRGKIVSCKHEVQNRRGQVLQAQTTLYPGDAAEGQKPTFLLAQTKLLKASSRAIAPASSISKTGRSISAGPPEDHAQPSHGSLGTTPNSTRLPSSGEGILSAPGSHALALGSQDAALASDDNIFDELKTTRCTSWQYELRQMEKVNRLLAEELGQLLGNKKKRKRRKGVGNTVRDCANCHTRNTPEWRRGPSGQRDLCNSCGLRWAKQTGRVSPRNSSRGGGDSQSKKSNSPNQSSPLHREVFESSGEADAGTTKVSRTNGSISAPNSGGSGGASSPSMLSKGHGVAIPPPSQPLLEGGSGAGGQGMEMTSIREEREMST